MQLLLNLAMWSYVTWFTSGNLTDMEWDTFLPDMMSLCPSVDVCGKTGVGITNVSGEENPCCLECSCHQSCHDHGNCCFDDENIGPNKQTTTCLKPSMSKDLKLAIYRFMTDPPIDGCKVQENTSTCSSDVAVAPWGNFFPVYSKSLDMNFKNEPCALCHGADITDIEHWTSVIVYTNISPAKFVSEMTEFFETYNSGNVAVAFEPPSEQSSSQDNRCFEVVDGCSLKGSSFGYIPSSVQLDEAAIAKACTQGPRAMYIANSTHAFKNAYCALCNGFTQSFTDSIKCVHKEESRSLQTQFSSLVDTKFLQFSKTAQNDKERRPCYRRGSESNASVCVQPYCPTLQIRFPNGECDFPAVDTALGCIGLYLNISTAYIVDKPTILNMTETRIISMFEASNPWPDGWRIRRIVMLTTTHRTEFAVMMALRTTRRFDMRQLTTSIKRRLPKRWSLFVNEDVYFTQRFLNRMPRNKVTLYMDNIGFPRFCPDIGQSFFCQQIELQPSEYMLESWELHLVHNNKTLYKREYLLVNAKDGSEKVRVCLEDSGYVKVDSTSNGDHVFHGTTYVPQFLVILLAYAFV